MNLLTKVILGGTIVLSVSTGIASYHANRYYTNKWCQLKSTYLDELTTLKYQYNLTQNQIIKEKNNITDFIQNTKHQKLFNQLNKYKYQYNTLIEKQNLKQISSNMDYHMKRFMIYNSISLLSLLFIGGCSLVDSTNRLFDS